VLLSLRHRQRSFVWAILLFIVSPSGPLLAATPPIVCSPFSTRAGFAATPPMHNIACPALPDVPYIAAPVNLPEQASTYEDWAWKSFIALNWPAVPMTNLPATNQRGIPDMTQSFANAGNSVYGVWETWKEKRELFSVDDSVVPADWNAPINYPDNAGLAIPACPGEELQVKALGTNHRLFAQAGKGAISALSLDEALQVGSESGPPATTSITTPVQPQVWYGVRTASGENAVLYEVKFNYDYYNYVTTNNLYLDKVKKQRRMNSGLFNKYNGPGLQGKNAISFPRRMGPTPVLPNTPPTVYDVSYCEAHPSQGTTSSDPLGYPCLAGAVQTKASWRRITEAEKSDFHWVTGIYYKQTATGNPALLKLVGHGLCKAVGDFGLIGLHIIQKTSNQGHYIYATWEHKSVSTDLYTYAEKPVSPPAPRNAAEVPAFPNYNIVKRDHPILKSTMNTNNAYNTLIRAVNPNSVWLNYQMTGVQFIPVQCWTPAGPGQPLGTPCPDDKQVGLDDPTNNGQPFYLANLVLETNWGLQNFQGVPPGLTAGPYNPVPGFATSQALTKPNDHYLPNNSAFNRSLGNVGHSRQNRGQVFNMGGCMGCHGIAQSLGTDFSFALFLGQQGAIPEGPNQEQPLGPLSFGNHVSIQNTSADLAVKHFLGIGTAKNVVVTSGPAEQQFVLIDPKNPSSMAPLKNGSTVALRSITRGGYLIATSTVGSTPDGTNGRYQVQLTPGFDGAAQWTIKAISHTTGALKKGDRFCLMNNQLKIGDKNAFMSRSTNEDVVVVDHCTTVLSSLEHWAIQEPFAHN
jgi:hypothetical protein